jgi:hypothetical protein
MVSSLLGEWLQLAPIWLIALILFVGMALFALLGWQLRQRNDAATKASGESKDESSQEGYIVSSVMGLLALLVGFTFSLAIDRFDTRRERVLLEANAIGTTYLRTQLLDEPHRARISKLLVDYTDLRINLAQAGPGAKQDRLLARSNQQITDLWTATVAAFPSVKGYDFSSSYIESMNDMIDMDAARQQARRTHVPSEVFLILFTYQFIAAGVIGYVLVGRKGRQTATLLLLLFGFTLVLVIDIDRPTGGGIVESQEPMLELRDTLKAQPPAIFDRFNGPAVAQTAPVKGHDKP